VFLPVPNVLCVCVTMLQPDSSQIAGQLMQIRDCIRRSQDMMFKLDYIGDMVCFYLSLFLFIKKVTCRLSHLSVSVVCSYYLHACCGQVLFLPASVCLSVCLSAQNLENY